MTTEIEIQPQVELNMEQNDGLVSKDDGVQLRSARTIRKPVRFRNDDHIDPDDIDSTQTNDDNATCKVKRILAKKQIKYQIKVVSVCKFVIIELLSWFSCLRKFKMCVN